MVDQIIVLNPRIDAPTAIRFRDKFERDRSLQLCRDQAECRDGAIPGKILVEVFIREVDIGRKFEGEWNIPESVGGIGTDLEIIAPARGGIIQIDGSGMAGGAPLRKFGMPESNVTLGGKVR